MWNINEAIRESIEQLVTSEGYELVHAECRGGSGRPILRIFVDRPGGITLDDCQIVSKQISTLLEVEDPIPYKYILEVSSPGLDRSLYKEADYVRFMGRRVRLTLRNPLDGRRRYRGKLIGAGSGVVRITDVDQCEWCFEMDAIEKANLEIEI